MSTITRSSGLTITRQKFVTSTLRISIARESTVAIRMSTCIIRPTLAAAVTSAADHVFLERVAKGLMHVAAILITGPASAKTELAAHLKHVHPDLAKRVSGVESLDHPTEGAPVAFARIFFRADDRMHSQI